MHACLWYYVSLDCRSVEIDDPVVFVCVTEDNIDLNTHMYVVPLTCFCNVGQVKWLI